MECLCLGTTDLIVAPWKFDVLKTSIFSARQQSADSFLTETLLHYCLNSLRPKSFVTQPILQNVQ